MVASYIMNLISKDLAGDVIYADTIRDLWIDLEEKFSQIYGHHIFKLQQRISSISQGQDSIITYY